MNFTTIINVLDFIRYELIINGAMAAQIDVFKSELNNLTLTLSNVAALIAERTAQNKDTEKLSDIFSRYADRLANKAAEVEKFIHNFLAERPGASDILANNNIL